MSGSSFIHNYGGVMELTSVERSVITDTVFDHCGYGGTMYADRQQGAVIKIANVDQLFLFRNIRWIGSESWYYSRILQLTRSTVTIVDSVIEEYSAYGYQSGRYLPPHLIACGSFPEVMGPSVLVVANVIIRNNNSTGAFQLGECRARFTNVIITNNTAVMGTAVQLANAIVTIDHSTIIGNHASQYGGAFWFQDGLTSLTITNSVIMENSCDQFGGAFAATSNPARNRKPPAAVLINNTIVNNRAPYGNDAQMISEPAQLSFISPTDPLQPYTSSIKPRAN
jgi:hypothetical protein